MGTDKSLINEWDTVYPITIYNWKDYDGGYSAMSSESYKWHIGGNAGIVSAYVNEYFDNGGSRNGKEKFKL